MVDVKLKMDANLSKSRLTPTQRERSRFEAADVIFCLLSVLTWGTCILLKDFRKRYNHQRTKTSFVLNKPLPWANNVRFFSVIRTCFHERHWGIFLQQVSLKPQCVLVDYLCTSLFEVEIDFGMTARTFKRLASSDIRCYIHIGEELFKAEADFIRGTSCFVVD